MYVIIVTSVHERKIFERTVMQLNGLNVCYYYINRAVNEIIDLMRTAISVSLTYGAARAHLWTSALIGHYYLGRRGSARHWIDILQQ